MTEANNLPEFFLKPGEGTAPPVPEPPRIHYLADGELEVDIDHQRVTHRGVFLAAELSSREFHLLAVLAQWPNYTFSWPALQEIVRQKVDDPLPSTDSVSMCLVSLRKKLGPKLGDAKHGVLQTVRGRGVCAVTSMGRAKRQDLSTGT